MQLTRTILAEYGQQCLRARDRRGVWRPAAHCERRLVVETGSSESIASACRDAVERVAEQIKRTAHAAR